MNLLIFDIFGRADDLPPEIQALSCSPMQSVPISSPCIKVCAVSGESGLCIGCGRTLAEIAGWAAMSEAEREAVMADLPRRLSEGKAKAQ